MNPPVPPQAIIFVLERFNARVNSHELNVFASLTYGQVWKSMDDGAKRRISGNVSLQPCNGAVMIFF